MLPVGQTIRGIALNEALGIRFTLVSGFSGVLEVSVSH